MEDATLHQAHLGLTSSLHAQIMRAPVRATRVVHGVCDFSYDPNTRAVVDTTWAQHTYDFGARLVRLVVACDTRGGMPTRLLNQALDAYAHVGLPALVEFAPNFVPAQIATGAHANMALNTTGDRCNSPYIDALTLRGLAVAKAAKAHGLTDVIWWNEPNELLVHEGDLIPPGEKGGSLAPSVAAVMYYQAALRLHSIGVRCWNGALSVLPQGGLNKENGYYAAWLTTFYETLARLGKHPPYPWAGWCLNMEGVWTSPHFNSALGVLRERMAHYHDTTSVWNEPTALRLTEWGWSAGPSVVDADVGMTMDAIESSEVLSATFFQGPGMTPYLGPTALYKGKGAWQWVQDGVVFRAEGDYAWAASLRPRYAARRAAAIR